MPRKQSRTEDLKEMARYVGNGAAHIALYKDQPAILEASNYFGNASGIAGRRTWNKKDPDFFRREADRLAQRVIRARHKPGSHDALAAVRQNARDEIEKFIQAAMRIRG